MARKSKVKEVDLLYTNPKMKEKKVQKKKVSKGSINKKTTNIPRNEIVIGLKPKVEKDDKKQKNKKPIKKAKIQKKKTLKDKKQSKKKSLRFKVIEWTSIVCIIIVAIILFLLSDVFNTKEITVEGNDVVSDEEIINLSGFTTNENMFKLLNSQAKKNLKQNAYIENVKIHKKLDGEVKIIVTERVVTYMLQYETSYAYINNQGYVLEISDVKKEVPLIAGYKTPVEEIQTGKRLNVEDLEILGDVIKIMQVANSNGIIDKITYIDVSDNESYILKMENEGKTVHFGNNMNINEKVLWMVELLEAEKDVSGEMFIQDIKKVYFRESV